MASAATVGLVAGGVGFASASGNTTSAGRTLTFEVEFSPFFFLDLGEPGPSMGDQIVSHDVLLDENGQQVGHDGVSCILTDPAGPRRSAPPHSTSRAGRSPHSS